MACGKTKDGQEKNVSNDNITESNSQNSKNKHKEVTINNKDDFDKYAQDFINKNKEYFDNSSIEYEVSPDNKVIVNKNMETESLGKTYKNIFLTSVGLDTLSGNVKSNTLTYLTGHIDDKFTADNGNIKLAYERLNNIDNPYKSIDEFVAALNKSIEAMKNKEKSTTTLQENESCNIMVGKKDNKSIIFISTNESIKTSYASLKPMEFSTYQDYKNLICKTNGEIYINNKNNIYNSQVPDSDGFLNYPPKFYINTSSSDKDTYEYGIPNVGNPDLATGDFTINLMMEFEGKLDNLSIATSGFCTLLKTKFNYEIDEKELENYLKSVTMYNKTVFNVYGEDSYIDSFIEKNYQLEKGYFIHSLSFPGITNAQVIILNDKYTINIDMVIPAIVEGKTKR